MVKFLDELLGNTRQPYAHIPISAEAEDILRNSYPNWEDIVYEEHEPETYKKHTFEDADLLVKTDLKYVDYYLARNPHTAKEILNRIAPLVYVIGMSEKVALNPNCDLELLNKMLKQAPQTILSRIGWVDDDMFEKWVKKATLNPSYAYILANPNLPKKILNSYIATMETMNYNRENFLLSQNPALPVDVIEEMFTMVGNGIDREIMITQNPTVPATLVSKQWNDSITEGDVYAVEALIETGRGTPQQLLKTKLWVTCADYSTKKYFIEDEDGGQNSHWGTTKKEKVSFLKQHYPEVSTKMPEEWLITLLNGLPQKAWLTNPEDFPNPLTKTNERVMSYH